MTRKRLTLILLTCLSLTACATDSDSLPASTTAPAAFPADPLDARVAAMLALVESAHRQADLSSENNDLPAAAAAMTALISDLESSTLDHPERTLFLIDAHGRLARLQIHMNLPDAALATLTAGLRWHQQTPRPTLFGGYLLQIKGDLLRDLNDDRGAIQAHKEAILVFKSIMEGSP